MQSMPSMPDRIARRDGRRTVLAGALLALAGWPARQALAAYQVRPWAAGRAAPKLELVDLDGKPWQLSGLKGRPLVMNFWASWCEPCRAEMPSLEQLAQRHERDGLVVVAVNYKESVPTIRRFLDAQPVALPILLDRDGEAASAWTPRVFPSTVLIDRNGQPRQVVVGELDWTGSAARELVASLIGQSRST